MLEILQLEFMRNAVLAALVASLICGIIGSLVVVNRIVFLSGGIAHAAYGGIGLSFFLGWPFMAGTLLFAMVAALVMAAVSIRAKHRADTIIGVIWAVGMATGVVLIDVTPGYHVDLMSYLFGSILAVPTSNLWQLLGMSVGLVAVLLYFYEGFLAMSYDDEFARLRGVPVRFLYYLLICLVALAVVFMIRIVGLILVIALLTIPPYIAEKMAGSLSSMMVLSGILSAVFCLVGLFLSYQFNLTSGASIILVAAAGFFLSMLLEWLAKKRHH